MNSPSFYISMLKDGQYYLFAGQGNNGTKKYWTQDAKKAVAYTSDLDAWKAVDQFFNKSDRNKILIKMGT